MGMFSVDNCVFTDLPVQDIQSGWDGIEYYVTVANNKYLMRLDNDAVNWNEDDFFTNNKYLFYALIINKKWFSQTQNVISLESLKKLIEQSDYPRTPQQKVENLFFQSYKLQKEDGQEVDVFQSIWRNSGWRPLYFKSAEETMFYFSHLASSGLIKMKLSKEDGLDKIRSYYITYAGLEYALKLEAAGDKSNRCFVAMSFDPSTKNAREAIKQALIQTGYEAIIIDEQIIDSERTINDEIIASIKKSKFCIADFSLHSKGVYFESGFALGQGKKVIYTCSIEEFEKAHFDIKPLQHIIYESEEQLTQDLINKIEAFIN